MIAKQSWYSSWCIRWGLACSSRRREVKFYGSVVPCNNGAYAGPPWVQVFGSTHAASRGEQLDRLSFADAFADSPCPHSRWAWSNRFLHAKS
jgi:hypothetical protein